LSSLVPSVVIVVERICNTQEKNGYDDNSQEEKNDRRVEKKRRQVFFLSFMIRSFRNIMNSIYINIWNSLD